MPWNLSAILLISSLSTAALSVISIGDSNGERLLVHTIALAKELGICVTAEGVESQEQVEFLKNIDCDSIQGFYYSKPLPLTEYEMLLD